MGSGSDLPGQLLSTRWGLCSVFWDQKCRLPTQPGFGNKRFKQVYLPGCSVESLVRSRATPRAICRGAHEKCSMFAPPQPC